MRTGLLLVSPAIGVFALAGPARAQYDVRGHVSSAGLDFIAEQVPSLVPTSIDAPDLSRELACIVATQRDTHVELQVNRFSLTIPEEGTLRLSISLGARGDGEVFIDNAIACLGSLTCQDHIEVADAAATIDFDVSTADGRPAIALRSVDLQLGADDVDLTFSGCAVDSIANTVVGFAKQFVIDLLLSKAEELAASELGPLLESLVGGIGSFSGSFATPVGTFDLSASLDQLVVRTGGIDLGASVDLSSSTPAAECVAEFDQGEPDAAEGSAPDLAAVPAHIGLAVNLGLAQDALYQVWRQGLTCVTGDSLEGLGIELPIDQIASIMPGFPPGSTLSVEARLTRPPRVAGAGDGQDGISLTLAVDGVEVVLRGVLPDGSERRIQVGLDVAATASVGIDRDSNALVATPERVSLERLEMDQVTVAETGFDVARMSEVLRDQMMPKLLAELGPVPLTGPVFVAGPLPFAVILRSMESGGAYMSAHADLFRVPETDDGAPQTSIIDHPSGVVSPADAGVRVSGTDGLIPTELLRYEVAVNGEARPASYIRRFTVGEAGASGTYEVEVAALDLHGNRDLSPARVQIEVDGIAPDIFIAGERVRKMEGGGAAELTWEMEDDRTAATALETRIELFRVVDPADLLAVEHVRTIELGRGATAGQVEIGAGELYRAELHVIDAVGNESTSAILLDASKAGGGCSAQTGGGGPWLGVLVLALGLGRTVSAARGRSRAR